MTTSPETSVRGTVEDYSYNAKKDLRYEIRLTTGERLTVNHKLILNRSRTHFPIGTPITVTLRGSQVVAAALEPVSPSIIPDFKPSAPESSSFLDVIQQDTGRLISVTPLYGTVEFTSGDRANIAYSKWDPSHGAWAVGTPLTARYSASRFEIVEVIAPPINNEQRAFQWQGDHTGIGAFFEAVKEHIEWYRPQPGHPALYETPTYPLPSDLIDAITSGGLKSTSFQLYRHQARALDALRQGQNVLLVTQTASGKTLAFNPAIFETLLTSDPTATALFIYPLNALRMDQTQKLENLAIYLNNGEAYINVAVLEAGQSNDKRNRIARGEPHLLSTNPELLSLMLSEQATWYRFFQRLRYVVIDEVHFYRGILGNHMAGLLRRLRLAAERYGANPQFVLCSATVRDPLDLAERLTALSRNSFTLLDESTDGSQQALKHWAILSPNAVSAGSNGYLQAAASAMVELLCTLDEQGNTRPLHTILFAKSTRAVNYVYNEVVKRLQKVRPEFANKIGKFVANQRDNFEKQKIFDDLQNGRYVGVVATNALEAGIDIGHLDACVLAGFPHTMMRMRQMAGRVGRRGEGIVLYIPQPGAPLDEYYREHPNELLDQKPEVFTVDADNYYIARKHLNQAALELNGLTREQQQLFGKEVDRILREGIHDRVLSQNGNRVFGSRRNYQNLRDPYAITNIRGNVQVPYTLCKAGPHACPNSTSGTCSGDGASKCLHRIALIDQQYVFRDAHPGAIYEDFQSKFWRISDFDLEKQVVRATELADDTLERTAGREDIEIRILNPDKVRSRPLSSGANLHWGAVRVTRTIDEYAEYKLEPRWKCRTCKVEFRSETDYCSTCNRHTELYYEEGKRKYKGFTEEYSGKFRIQSETIGVWLTLPPEWESAFHIASPCRLRVEKNRVQALVQAKDIPVRQLSSTAATSVRHWHTTAHTAYKEIPSQAKEAGGWMLPGIYAHCLMHQLRNTLSETESRAAFQQITGYDVTEPVVSNNGRPPKVHICAQCTAPQLLNAMHTLEHTMALRYPSVILGDLADIAAYTTIAHPQTAEPTIFWYDMVEGGIGAAEKMYDRFEELIAAAQQTLRDCRCTRIEGCPRCTQMARCERQNEQNDLLNKAAGILLSQRLLDQPLQTSMQAYTYASSQRRRVSTFTVEDEFVSPPSASRTAPPDPFTLLRVQRHVHDVVLERALEVRSGEIPTEQPPVSAQALNAAYLHIHNSPRPNTWDLQNSMTPHEILQILNNASPLMVKRVYYSIVRELHPDRNQNREEWATTMMKLVNEAYGRIRRQQRPDENSV